ncbi:MAG: alpha/beta hydrolase [Candidatus Eremiobacteraeota bacterium]|nr:alpha/beta hydrolase [Candidatus Eremiobacteraeota bacterium]
MLAALSLLALFLCVWIVIPGPTLALFALSVGAIEVSPLLALGDALILVWAACSRRGLQRNIALSASAIALSLAVVPTVAYIFASPHVPIGQLLAPMRATGIVRTALTDPNVIVFHPQRTGVYAVVIAIYGGAWQRGSPGNDAALNAFIASRGYVVFAIDYRHAPAARFPAQLDDVDAASRWVSLHARDYNGDRTRIVLLGHSSGAQLAFLLAARHPNAFRGVITYESPVDLRMGYLYPSQPDVINARRIISDLCGGPPDERPGCYRHASPLENVHSHFPPLLMIAGRRDHVVVASYEYKLRNRLRAAGDRVEYLELPWADHAFETVFNGLNNHVAMWYLLAFLEEADGVHAEIGRQHN